MHIAFQRSGGRGEYEVVGSHSGYTAISLEGWTFNLSWPDGLVRETGLGLEPAGSGKPRLRSLLDPPFQIGRMVAAMCMLPDPRRAYAGASAELPIIARKGYVLSRLGFGSDTEFSPLVDMVTIEPSFIDLEDAATVMSLGIDARWRRVSAIYDTIPALPSGLADALDRHRAFMASGETVSAALTQIVSQIERSLAQADPRYVLGQDPVDFLEHLLNIPTPQGPAIPTPDRLGEDEPAASARSAHLYRLARTRGPGARRFSLAVRTAYKHSCAFCGCVFGGVPGILPGVDAAHILAWSKHDLDVVTNGISLCKLHHWAFDAALMMPVGQKDGSYTLRFTTLAEEFPVESRQRLLPSDGMVIPSDWLPAQKSERPSRTYLEKLYADLAVTFAS